MAENFERVEKKYLLNEKQLKAFKSLIKDYVTPSKYTDYTVMSLYFDNDKSELIRKSIEKPLFKEKLRIRSYTPPQDNDYVFVEIKRKLNGVVYKRRTKAKYKELIDNIYTSNFEDKQIGKEIRCFIDRYGPLNPSIYVSCERKCFEAKENKDIRITIDENIKYRTDNLFLSSNHKDKKLMDQNVVEIKVNGAMPLWLSKILDENNMYSIGVSKVGRAYTKEEVIRNGII